jgi:hypothetical protein
MKKALLILSFFLSLAASAQWTKVSAYGYIWNRGVFDSGFYLPSNNPISPYRAGGVKYVAADSSIYVWTGTQYVRSGTSSTFNLNQVTGIGNWSSANIYLKTWFNGNSLAEIGYTGDQGYLRATDTTTTYYSKLLPSGLQWQRGLITGLFKWDNLATSNKTIQLPNSSGTVALTSDLASAGYGLNNAAGVFSVDSTGVADASAIIQAGINAGYKVIYVPKGKYLLSSTIQLKDSVSIVGDGRPNSIIKLTSNITAFKCGFALGGTSAQFRDFSILGSNGSGVNGMRAAYDSSVTTDQIGITIDSVTGVYINNIGAYKLGGYAIATDSTCYYCTSAFVTQNKGNAITNCIFKDNYGGVFFGVRSEYATVANCHIDGGKYGIRTPGGNNRIENNDVSNNLFGLYIEAGTNNGHGIASGNTINHCDTALYVTTLTRGFKFIGNYFLITSIKLVSSSGLIFTSNEFSQGSITVENCTNTSFNDISYWSGGSTPTWVITGTAPSVSYAVPRLQTLVDGATVTWNMLFGGNATLSLAGNRTLDITNVAPNTSGTLKVVQDATGSRTLTLPANSKVRDGGTGAVTLTATAAAIDILTFFYDGTNYYWDYRKNYN